MSVECPICGASFPADDIATHASACDGAPPPSAAPPHTSQAPAAAAAAAAESDLELARRLQAEFDAAGDAGQHRKTLRCDICSGNVTVDDMYILDDCSHRFCKDCLIAYVAEKLATSVAVQCPVSGCKKPLSVRDMKDLVPLAIAKTKRDHSGSRRGGSSKRGGGSSRQASARIMEELRHISASHPEKNVCFSQF